MKDWSCWLGMLRQEEGQGCLQGWGSHSQSFSVSLLSPTLLQLEYGVPPWSFFPQIPSALVCPIAFLDLPHLYPSDKLEAAGVTGARLGAAGNQCADQLRKADPKKKKKILFMQ